MSSFRVSLPGLTENKLPGMMLLLKGPDGVGKTPFAIQFVREGLDSNEYAVYISFDTSQNDFIRYARTLGLEAEHFISEGRLRYLDFFSKRPVSINDVSIALDKELSGVPAMHARVVVDSLTSLGFVSAVDVIPPWVLQVNARLKERDILGLLILVLGVHPPSFELAVQTLCEGILEMRLEELPDGQLRRLFRIYGMKGVPFITKWSEFQIGKSGLQFL